MNQKNVLTLGNLIIDFLLYIDQFPVQAQDLQGVSHIDIGPGGACNVAIVASRLGLPTACLGEIGDDTFGRILIDSLKREGINTDYIQINKGNTTPVAGVLVDPNSEPAYLGYPGQPQVQDLPEEWPSIIAAAQALFVDGWIEYESLAEVNISALKIARENGIPTFFDPGPGNPRQNNDWHQKAAALSSVILATESELETLFSPLGALDGAEAILQKNADLVVIKLGADGAKFITKDQIIHAPGLPVEAVDATGAGDSMAAAVMYAVLNNLPLQVLANLANATGAAKVGKIGTGHNLPHLEEIQAILSRFNLSPINSHQG